MQVNFSVSIKPPRSSGATANHPTSTTPSGTNIQRWFRKTNWTPRPSWYTGQVWSVNKRPRIIQISGRPSRITTKSKTDAISQLPTTKNAKWVQGWISKHHHNSCNRVQVWITLHTRPWSVKHRHRWAGAGVGPLFLLFTPLHGTPGLDLEEICSQNCSFNSIYLSSILEHVI
jgi:hypothetical protein